MNIAELEAEWAKEVVVEVRGTRALVEATLNQLAATYPERWRVIRKIARTTDYRGRGLYTAGNEGEVNGE